MDDNYKFYKNQYHSLKPNPNGTILGKLFTIQFYAHMEFIPTWGIETVNDVVIGNTNISMSELKSGLD